MIGKCLEPVGCSGAEHVLVAHPVSQTLTADRYTLIAQYAY
jgi:hypothetical protein